MRGLLLLGSLLVAIIGESRERTPLELAYGHRWHPAWGVLALWTILMVM